jgi:hypothetical protein
MVAKQPFLGSKWKLIESVRLKYVKYRLLTASSGALPLSMSRRAEKSVCAPSKSVKPLPNV